MPELYLGLMSGTSMDGVDAALCAFEAGQFAGLRGTASLDYPPELRGRLLRLQREPLALTLAEYATLDNAVADRFADAALQLLAQPQLHGAPVCAIGSHGQTVFHDPEGVRSSLQLGNPALIAARTGLTTVGDFRRADLALGGHGAPLVPAFHHALFASVDEPRCLVNLGGIANITILPDGEAGQVRGFDTGPGNALMDEWAERILGLRYDEGGRLAGAGAVHADLLAALRGDPYFAQPPPKSTGRSHFNLDWATRRYPGLDRLSAADVQRTFCELTALTVGEAVRRHAPATRRVLPCGGGALNGFLIERLQQHLDGVVVEHSGRYGIDVSWVEAAAFAWLALRTMHGLPGNLPAVTGARRAAVLGGIYRC